MRGVCEPRKPHSAKFIDNLEWSCEPNFIITRHINENIWLKSFPEQSCDFHFLVKLEMSHSRVDLLHSRLTYCHELFSKRRELSVFLLFRQQTHVHFVAFVCRLLMITWVQGKISSCLFSWFYRPSTEAADAKLRVVLWVVLNSLQDYKSVTKICHGKEPIHFPKEQSHYWKYSKCSNCKKRVSCHHGNWLITKGLKFVHKFHRLFT